MEIVHCIKVRFLVLKERNAAYVCVCVCVCVFVCACGAEREQSVRKRQPHLSVCLLSVCPSVTLREQTNFSSVSRLLLFFKRNRHFHDLTVQV
jgi:hypothetical protein